MKTVRAGCGVLLMVLPIYLGRLLQKCDELTQSLRKS